jgi:L-ascorbate metabolism protein UlaG (beta-lactamase superfamily)
MTAWSGWVIESDDHKVFFSGDTGLTDDFQEIGQRLGPFDLVMLEIGAFHPSWGDIHLGPENALKALSILGGGDLLPVHWGTFNLAMHAWYEPAETLWQLASSFGARVLTPPVGRPIEPNRIEHQQPWWREVKRRR